MDRVAWMMAVLWYGVGDIATTWTGFKAATGTFAEANLMVLALHVRLYRFVGETWTSPVLELPAYWWAALVSLLVVKIVAIAAVWVAWVTFGQIERLLPWWPTASRRVVPAATALVGLVLVVHNGFYLVPGITMQLLQAVVMGAASWVVLEAVGGRRATAA